jgi:hypothetical protein
MNIFYLDRNPNISAKAMTDKHVVKMILESAQLLSTAHHMLDTNETPKGIYKKTHVNHPSAIWVRESSENYKWLYNHFIALCDEYTERYGRVHKTDLELSYILSNIPKHIPHADFTQPPQAMPDIYKHRDSVHAYHVYYQAEKLHMSKDKERFFKICPLAVKIY